VPVSVPVLEVALRDRHAGEVRTSTSGDPRHLRTGLDRVNGDVALREHQRRLAGAGTDLEGTAPAGQRDHLVDERVRIRRPDAVIALGDLSKHQPRRAVHTRESISSLWHDRI
jgi:hypothetical protein